MLGLFQVLLNSSKHTSKSSDYTFLHRWLGTGRFIIYNLLFIIYNLLLNAFKCNLKELTTKTANSTRDQRSVWKRMRSSVAFRSCGIGPAVRGVFQPAWPRALCHLALPLPPFPFFGVFLFLSTEFSVSRVPIFGLLCMGARGWVAALCQPWGHYSV